MNGECLKCDILGNGMFIFRVWVNRDSYLIL